MKMCIRDRGKFRREHPGGGVPEIDQAYGQILEAVPLQGDIHRMGPVSYTHLDVYKRQKTFQPFIHEDEDAASGPLLHQAGQRIVFRTEGSVGKARSIGKIQPDIQRMKGHFRRNAMEWLAAFLYWVWNGGELLSLALMTSVLR